jgi:hypothetical protein
VLLLGVKAAAAAALGTGGGAPAAFQRGDSEQQQQRLASKLPTMSARIKTDHAGAKNGGGYYGRRAEAKEVCKGLRRREDREEVAEQLPAVIYFSWHSAPPDRDEPGETSSEGYARVNAERYGRT